jgi:hypothetical protein
VAGGGLVCLTPHMATGKIARLPRHIRNKLSQRLDDGEGGDSLLEWLNGLPEVKKLCAQQFQSIPVSKQNLSDFKQGPHLEWVRSREACELAERLAEQADDLGGVTDEANVSDALGRVLGIELARMAQTLLSEAKDPQERWQRLQEVLGQLAQLRREDHRWQRLQIYRERREEEHECHEQEQHEKKVAKAERQAVARAMRASLAVALGGGETGRAITEISATTGHDLPLLPPAASAFAEASADKPASPNVPASGPVKDSQG